jgi:hypothetical protein
MAKIFERNQVLRQGCFRQWPHFILEMKSKFQVFFRWRHGYHGRILINAKAATKLSFVVSFNERHLRAAREFGIEILRPADLLKLIGEIK